MSAPYVTVVADPPWQYDSPGTILRSSLEHRPNRDQTRLARLGSGSEARYGAMSVDELKALPVESMVADDAHLYLWATNAFVCEAHDIARAWGFAPKTILTWTKVHHADRSQVSMKTGYYFRGATEHVVFAVRGSLRLQTKRALPTGFLWPRLPHSVKPDAFFDLVEEASPGPFLEMFARRQRMGWDTWGNQALEHVSMEAAE